MTRWARGSTSRSDSDDLDESPETLEALRVARVDREARGARGSCDQEIQCPAPMRLASARYLGSVYPTIGSGRFTVEGKGIKGGLRPLQSIPSTLSLFGVVGRVRSGSELCQRDGADRQLDQELSGVELLQASDNGGADDSMPGALGIRHWVRGPEMQRCRGRRGAGPARRLEHHGTWR